MTLGVGESRLIDFAEEQKAGNLHADFNQGALELRPNTEHTSIVSELFSFDEKNGGYVVGSSFASHPARGTGSIWRIDGTFQTTIVIEKTAEAADQMTLKLFWETGAYEKTFDVAAGG